MPRNVWVVTLAGLTLLGGRGAFAQVTYTVFPAVSSTVPSLVAQPTGTSATSVTLVLHDSTIAYAVRTLTRQAHLRLMYDGTDQRFLNRVNVNVVGTTVLEALTSVLKGTELKATLASDGVTVLIAPPMTSGLSGVPHARFAVGVVTGRVTDSASGAGLSGASVKVEGTKLSAVTSDSGHFTLKDVPAGDQVLTVKLFGYKPAERSITVVDSGRTAVHITMVRVPSILSGVVTTATGTQRKVEVGNDITSLNVDSIMKVAPISSVTDLLETRVPGLTVLHSSGAPGDPSRLRLRGAGSIQGNNDPIVIVDGVRVYASQSDPRNDNLAPAQTGGINGSAGLVNIGGNSTGNSSYHGSYAAPSPLDQIDPNSIETIEVFKGPSASALYGSDAANGVIVITTKHGHAGPTQWQLALGAGVNWLPGSWPTNYYRFGVDALNSGPLCPWNDVTCHVDSVVAFQALNDPQYSVFSHGHDQTASLTVSGGVPTLQYSMTGTVAGDVGNLKLPSVEQQRYETLYGPIPGWMVRPDNYQSWGVNGSLTASPTPQVRVILASSLFNGTQQRGSLEQAISQLEGDLITDAGISSAGIFKPLTTTPLITNDVERATDNQLTSTNMLTLTWQARSWLPISVTGGINTLQRTDNTYIPYGINTAGAGNGTLNNSQTMFIDNGDTTGSYGLGRGSSREQTLTAGTTMPLLGQRLSVAVGGTVQTNSTNDFSVYTNQLAPGVSVPTSFVQAIICSNINVCNASNNEPSSQSTTATSTYGWYVEPRFNVSSRLFVSPGFRLDGGSGSSGSTGALSAFPKVDVSYIALDRQNNQPWLGVLTQLRPRVAFGYAGTQPAAADRLRLLDATTVPQIPGLISGLGNLGCPAEIALSGSTQVPTVCLSTLGNTQLRPERTSDLEGGFDATLWRGRVSLTYSQYDKTTHDAIVAIPVPPSVSGLNAGTFTIEKNIGVVRNTGTEASVTATLLQSRAVSWNVGAILSNDNNLVVRLNPGQAPICYSGPGINPCQGTRIVAGYPINGEWARPIVSFGDANHNGIIDPGEIRLGDSAVYVGQPNPKYQLNVNTGVTLFNGRLSVNATFAYQNGLTQNNLGACTSSGFQALPNAPNTSLATEAAVVAANCSAGGVSSLVSSSNYTDQSDIGLIQTVNTFRFNDLSINYNVPTQVASWFRVPRMTVALQGSNLGLHSNYRGIDPGVNAFSTVSAGDETADIGQIPLPRVWWLRLTMGD